MDDVKSPSDIINQCMKPKPKFVFDYGKWNSAYPDKTYWRRKIKLFTEYSP